MRGSVTAMTATAYVDESVRENAPGVYVLAAAIVPDEHAPALRTALRDLLLPGEKRLHWHDESDQARSHLVKTLSSLGIPAVVAVSTPMGRTRQERARALCLNQLLWELAQDDIAEIVLESRRQRDSHDASTIGAAKRAKLCHPQVHFQHARPLDEPLLWLPDLFAGAVATERNGQPSYLAALAGLIVIVDVAPAH